MHVLVCDDDRVTRLMIARLLKQHLGCTVVECGDGLSAVLRLERESFDLILLDIQMPMANGVQVVKILRESGAIHRQPVVMITADGRAEVVEHLLKLGISDFIVKPVRKDSLLEKVGRLHERTRLAGTHAE